MHAYLGAEMAPQPLVPPLGQQVQIERPERGPEPVRIIDGDHGAVGIGRLQQVFRDDRPIQHSRKYPGRVHAAHLEPLVADQHGHAGGVGAPPADHHVAAAAGIPHQVSAQRVVRIVVLSSDQATQVQVQVFRAEDGFAR